MTRCTLQLSLILRYLKRLLFIDCLKDRSIIWALVILYYLLLDSTSYSRTLESASRQCVFKYPMKTILFEMYF